MEQGQFCFLTDAYFKDFPDDRLMRNKEVISGISHNRPCFFAFPDKQSPEIYWLIPISSKVEKYRVHYDKKMEKYGYCTTIAFGNVAGAEAVFLIQNTCPATQRYINNIYFDRKNVPVRIDDRLAEHVVRCARKTLSEYFRGKAVIFPDVRKIKAALQQQLSLQHTLPVEIPDQKEEMEF